MHKIGLASAVALTMALGGWSTANAAPAATCKMQQIGELDVILHVGSPVVDGKVNNVPVHLLVDSGSVATSLSRQTTARAGLTVKVVDYVTMYGTDGADRLGEVGVKTFQVGPFVAQNSNLAVLGRGKDETDGLLGIQFLRQSDVEFDLPHNKIRFFKTEGCTGDQVVYWGSAYSVLPIYSHTSNAMLDVDVKIGGRPVHATMDTGAYQSVVTPDIAARQSVHLTPAGEASGATGLSRVPYSVGTFDSFSFGEDETIKNARLNVADLWRHTEDVRLGSKIPIKVAGGSEMLLGADFFRAHRVYVSNSQNKVYVSYVGGPVFSVRAASPPSSPPPTGSTTP